MSAYTEEQKLLLMMKGLLVDATPEERAEIDSRISKIRAIVSDEIGKVALAFVVAEAAVAESEKGSK